jgi:hypothetical protein
LPDRRFFADLNPQVAPGFGSRRNRVTQLDKFVTGFPQS